MSESKKQLIPAQVEEKVAEAVEAQQANAAASTQHALASQGMALQTQVAEIDHAVRSVLSTAATELNAGNEHLQAAVEHRLRHFEAVCQRTNASVSLLTEYVYYTEGCSSPKSAGNCSGRFEICSRRSVSDK